MVLSADVKRVNGGFRVFSHGGRVDTGLDAIEWIRRGVERGAGEVVLNSIDTDGVKKGFDLEMLQAIQIGVPVVASGGAGGIESFVELFREVPSVDAVFAVYPFTPQQAISNAIISASYVPVFCGIGGVMFLLSDLILSPMYFGPKEKNNFPNFFINHLTYYIAQYLLALSIAFLPV